jgi:hypothetical protein
MFRHKKIVEENPAQPNLEVTLKPILGLPPALYLKYIYTILLLLGLFVIMLYPGLKNYGSYLHITSNTPGASVQIDGVLVGVTPLKKFVKAGEHTLTVSKPFFAVNEQRVKVQGKAWLTLIAPKNQRLPIALSWLPATNSEEPMPLAFLREATHHASFSLAIDHDSRFPREPILTQTAQTILTAREQNLVTDAQIMRWASDIWTLTADEDGYHQVLATWNLLARAGLFIDPVMITGLPITLNNTPFNQLTALREASGVSASLETPVITEATRPPITVLGQVFNYAPTTLFTVGNPNYADTNDLRHYPATVDLAGFYYTQSLISEAQFASFTRQPNALPDQSPFNQEARAAYPVFYVSYPQVQLYLTYLNDQLHQQGQPYQVRLPYEAEWEYLVNTNRITPTSFEWTDEPFIPLRNLLYSGQRSIYLNYSPFLRSVKGFNPVLETLPSYQRGAQPPEFMSPFVGFRLILEPIQ